MYIYIYLYIYIYTEEEGGKEGERKEWRSGGRRIVCMRGECVCGMRGVSVCGMPCPLFFCVSLCLALFSPLCLCVCVCIHKMQDACVYTRTHDMGVYT